MTHNRNARMLVRLETGFRTDAAQLKKLEQELTETLQSARHFGKKHGSPDAWNTRWYQQWDRVERILARIKAHVNEMDDSIESSDSERLRQALTAWEIIQSENLQLVEVLNTIRTEAIALDAPARAEWNQLARTLESHLATIDACAQALRIKLELLKKLSKEEMDLLVQKILAKLPNRARLGGLDAATYDQEYREAALELEREQHEFLGFMDVVKGLLLWDETTEERMDRNRAATSDPRLPAETKSAGGVPLNQSIDEKTTYASKH